MKTVIQFLLVFLLYYLFFLNKPNMQTKISDKRVQEALEYCQGILAPYDLVFSIKAIRASSRAAYINGIRALVITILRYQRGFKYTEIGYILNRDHTTILHLFKNYDTFSSGRITNFKEIRDSLVTISINRDILLEIERFERIRDNLNENIENLKKKLK